MQLQFNNRNLLIYTCLLCKSDNIYIVGRKVEGNKERQTAVCKNCGLIYRKLEKKESYISTNYYQKSEPDQNNLQKGYNRGIEIEQWISDTLLDNGFNKQTKVLDIGSGHGGVLKKIHELHGCDILGVEPDTSFAKYASEKMGVPTINSDFEEVKIEGKFDIVIMSHSIFCFKSPDVILLKVKSILIEGGILFISIGDYYHPKKFGGLENYLFKSYVLYYFSMKTMSRLLNKCGLSLLETEKKNGEVKFLARKETYSALAPDDLSENWMKVVFLLKLYDYKSFAFRIVRKMLYMVKIFGRQ
ncbi:class I SAM-dependent methyltransferase [Candidatus Marinimicrobia bacterium MT.SAG.4]|nr:class I SAM-dependent methyltransferase [Candidatus Marinimicrobia bacterium MT.SAG.4]